MVKIYAVRAGKTTGLFSNWTDCLSQVQGFPGAQFKSFVCEKTAQEWLN